MTNDKQPTEPDIPRNYDEALARVEKVMGEEFAALLDGFVDERIEDARMDEYRRWDD